MKLGNPMHPFEAMAEPARRRIVEILASGEHTSGNLAEILGVEMSISRTAVSKHLRILRDAGFVDVRAEERWRWYHLTTDGLTTLEAAVRALRYMAERAVGWNPELNVDHDPLRWAPRPVPRKGPGRDHRRGKRGTQQHIHRAIEPWDEVH